jgi:hypothetical protein
LLCPKGSCKFCFPFHLTWEFIISAFFFWPTVSVFSVVSFAVDF